MAEMDVSVPEFFPASEKALIPGGRRSFEPKYPWKRVPVGKSFAVLCSTIQYNSLKSLAYKTGKRLGMKFVVVMHAGSNSYEVARVE